MPLPITSNFPIEPSPTTVFRSKTFKGMTCVRWVQC
jgi:hypothetical protein